MRLVKQAPNGREGSNASLLEPVTQSTPQTPMRHLLLVASRIGRRPFAMRKHPISPSYPIYRKTMPRCLFGNSANSQTLTNHTQIDTARPVVPIIQAGVCRMPDEGKPSDLRAWRCPCGSARSWRSPSATAALESNAETPGRYRQFDFYLATRRPCVNFSRRESCRQSKRKDAMTRGRKAACRDLASQQQRDSASILPARECRCRTGAFHCG